MKMRHFTKKETIPNIEKRILKCLDTHISTRTSLISEFQFEMKTSSEHTRQRMLWELIENERIKLAIIKDIKFDILTEMNKK